MFLLTFAINIMKVLPLIISAIILLAAFPTFAQTTSPIEVTDSISFRFSKTLHDFGEIPVGKPVVAKFVIYNTGIKPLSIMQVKGYGYLMAKWSKDAIAPNDSSLFELTYYPPHVGYSTKNTTVYFHNSQQSQPLYIKAVIVE
jgi:hypothetical protein